MFKLPGKLLTKRSSDAPMNLKISINGIVSETLTVCPALSYVLTRTPRLGDMNFSSVNGITMTVVVGSQTSKANNI